ncbi:MAG TPA: phosphotransferase family protein [Mycobacteriales bacterium]|jgi:aminoglycoside phosphotransferase (APT) family kinase protein|nr:phosphotransferase family protein [Mycobacteriales bacterium]
MTDPIEIEHITMKVSSREPEEVRQQLETWIGGKLGDAANVAVSDLEGSEANGMSSDTVLFRARWNDGDGAQDERLVARIAPSLADVPVFPNYDLQSQFDVIRSVASLTKVPVPRPWWCEPTGAAMGAPMFVMSRVDGLVPPDVMPYPFGDNWVFDATPEQQQTLQDSTVEAIAALHAITDAPKRMPFLERDRPGDTHLRRHFAYTQSWYAMARNDGTRSELVERSFDWLEANWPAHEGSTVLSWGDSRIGNILYDDFRPAALLDWEMAGLGPRELDVAWLVYAHRVFQDITTMLGLPGMPHFLQPADVAAKYEALTGYAPRDLRFYMVYCAVQWGVVFLRTGARQAHFGEIEMPADVDELIRNSIHLESLLDDITD